MNKQSFWLRGKGLTWFQVLHPTVSINSQTPPGSNVSVRKMYTFQTYVHKEATEIPCQIVCLLCTCVWVGAWVRSNFSLDIKNVRKFAWQEGRNQESL